MIKSYLDGVTELQSLRLVLDVIDLHLSDNIVRHFLINLLVPHNGLLFNHFVTIAVFFERFLSVIDNPVEWPKVL